MSNNGSNNRPLSEQWVVSLLDQNPSFVVLCEILERSGYKFERTALAKALLEVHDGNGQATVQSIGDNTPMLTEAVVTSEESRGNPHRVSVQERGNSINQQRKTTEKIYPVQQDKVMATSTGPSRPAIAAPLTPMSSETAVQSTIKHLQAVENSNDPAVDVTTHTNADGTPTSAALISNMYAPPIPSLKNPTPQSVMYTSSGAEQEALQSDKQYVSPHLLWHGSQHRNPPPLRSQSLFFNSDDIAYIQDSHGGDFTSTQSNTHETRQPARLSEVVDKQTTALSTSNANHTNPSQHLNTTALIKPGLSTSSNNIVEGQEKHTPVYVANSQPQHTPLPASTAPVAQMAPVALMTGMHAVPVKSTQTVHHHQLPNSVNLPVLELPPPDTGPEIPKLSPLLRLLGTEKVVKRISKRKAARVSKYDPKTIARDVLLATGRHPNMAPLNSHLLPLLTTLGPYVEKDSDLETLRWDLIDPFPEAPKLVELADDDDDDGLVMGDLEPMARAESPEKNVTPSPPHPREPSGRRLGKTSNNKKDGESKQGQGRENKKRKLEVLNVDSTPTTSKSPVHSLTTGKVKAPHPRARLGRLFDSAIAARKIGEKDRRATMSVALTANGALDKGDENGIEKDTAPSPKPAARGPRMKLVVVSESPKETPKNPISRTSAWTSVNQVTPPTSSRSKLAAVVIHSRTQSAADAHDESVHSTNGKRKNEGVETSTRPKKRTLDTNDNITCGWKDCRADIRNIRTLTKHVYTAHKTQALHGGYPCHWEGCSGPVPAAARKGKASAPTEGKYLDFDTEKDWEAHLKEVHLQKLNEVLGGGGGVVTGRFSIIVYD